MSVLSQAATIIGVVIGAVWIGIGVTLGKDIYELLVQKKFKHWIRHSKLLKKKLHKVIKK